MVITFGEFSLGLWLLRVDYYLIIGLAVAVLDILPVIGSGSILVPWGLWLLLGGRPTLGAGILLLYAVVTAIRTVLEPRVVGRRIGLSPLVTLISMYAGMKLGGMAGLILAPMAVTDRKNSGKIKMQNHIKTDRKNCQLRNGRTTTPMTWNCCSLCVRRNIPRPSGCGRGGDEPPVMSRQMSRRN